MRMVITNIERNEKSIYVIGDTSVGRIKGRWCHNEEPILEETYFFELSISEIDRSKISIFRDEEFSGSVNLCDMQVLFKGVCEEIDDVYVIRFAKDWIEMITIENDDFSIKKGDGISFLISYDNIWIYPY
ncbi:MAG: hypothetical protein NC429_15700 [Lachnospiraceae bacterium]|nr:hypothetical protein [Lachnospiraceae bacterium]